MKPPDRPGPGRTDRILGVMGGMLRACALPGQEGVRRETKVGSGSLAGFRTAASPSFLCEEKQPSFILSHKSIKIKAAQLVITP